MARSGTNLDVIQTAAASFWPQYDVGLKVTRKRTVEP